MVKTSILGDVVKVNEILEKGADVDAKARNGNYPAIFLASALGYSDVVKLLLEKGRDHYSKV